MSDTFFTGAPHWTWFIIPYFFVGGLAGGAYFLAALLDWFGKPEDRPVVRTGYDVAAVGAILSGLLLTIDLGQPLRFWHMLFQSENFPAIMFKSWSPISFGAWAILLFGLLSVLSALGARSAPSAAPSAAAWRSSWAGSAACSASSSRATPASSSRSPTGPSGRTAPGWERSSWFRAPRPAQPRSSCSPRGAAPPRGRCGGYRRSTARRSLSSCSCSSCSWGPSARSTGCG